MIRRAQFRRCIAFQRAPRCAAWNRCRARVLERERFCAAHRDALDGALLGLLSHGLLRIPAEEGGTPLPRARINRREQRHSATS